MSVRPSPSKSLRLTPSDARRRARPTPARLARTACPSRRPSHPSTRLRRRHRHRGEDHPTDLPRRSGEAARAASDRRRRATIVRCSRDPRCSASDLGARVPRGRSRRRRTGGGTRRGAVPANGWRRPIRAGRVERHRASRHLIVGAAGRVGGPAIAWSSFDPSSDPPVGTPSQSCRPRDTSARAQARSHKRSAIDPWA
jgi:hypothetical protein